MGGDGKQIDDLKDQVGNLGPRDTAFPRARALPTCTIASFQKSSDLLAKVFPEL